VLNTPVPSGAELITDGDMELAGDVTNWANYGTPTTKEKSGTQKHGGSLSLHLVCDASSEGASQAKSLVANTWYKAEGYIYLVSGSGAGISLNPGNTTCIAKTATVGSWVGLNVYGLENSGSSRTAIARGMDASGSEFYADDISVKALTFTDLIKTVNVGQPDVIVSANFTQVSGTYQTNLAAGLILALDSPTSPANFILVDLRSASKLTIYKCVAGTYSAVGGATIDYTYSAGTLLRCSYNGTTLKVYYNNALVTTQTISDAGIASNTYHGIFNADGSTFDNFEVFGIT
jgi:hypothetical protein